MLLGEPNCTADISMGDFWPQDPKQENVALRLFRRQPFGVNWDGEVFFEAHERLELRIVVADDQWVIFRDGFMVLRNVGDPCDFNFRLVAQKEANVTFHSVSCRALTEEDARKASVNFPLRKLLCDTESARARVKSQIPDDWLHEPVVGKNFVLGDDLAMRWIAPGEFTMGSLNVIYIQSGKGAERVRISRGYWIGAYEVTQGQWQDVMGDNPSRITGSPLLPVNNVSWSDAKRFCTALSDRERKAGRLPDGYEYRIPTEAEWEYACRAGTDREAVVPRNELACRGEKYPHIVEVGTTPANPWGLHEVLGNVAEWCLDRWHDYPKNSELPTVDRFYEGDPTRDTFVVRGNGFWKTEVWPSAFVRTRRHDIAGGFRGFRVVLGPKIRPHPDRPIQKQKNEESDDPFSSTLPSDPRRLSSRINRNADVF